MKTTRIRIRASFTGTLILSISLSVVAIALALFLPAIGTAQQSNFSFALLGDRTGETAAGVYEAVWKAVDSENPSFVFNVGDSIQGGDDSRLLSEWRAFGDIVAPYRHFPFYFVPGNHDVWSQKSAAAYVRNSGRPLHYSFDFRQMHFTVLDNSRTEDLPSSELLFLESDLKKHAAQPVKFVLFHRPSWIMPVLLQNSNFPLHQLAKKYGVQYVICGHVHQMLRFALDSVTYISLPSAGGHLRNPKTYETGWFFGYSVVAVSNGTVSLVVKELTAPFGGGRVSKPESWGAAGLVRAAAQ